MKTTSLFMKLMIIGVMVILSAVVLDLGVVVYSEASNAGPTIAAIPTLIPSATPMATGQAIIPNTGLSASTLAPTATAQPATATPSATPTATPTTTPTSVAATVAASATPLAIPTTAPTAIPTATALPAPTQIPAPSVLLTNPTNGLTVATGQQIIIQATANGAAGLAHMDTWVDGALYATVLNPQGGSTAMAIAEPWTTTTPGTHTIVVVAYDNLGAVSPQATISIQVLNQPLPTAWFDQPVPTTGQIVYQAGDAIQLSYWGSAAAGVQRLELWADGQLAASDTNANQSTTLNIQHAWSSSTPGEHTLFVRVYDLLNQTTDSSPLVIGLTDRNPPSVTLVSPVNGAQLNPGQTFQIAISASDSKGITQIQLWIDNALYSIWNSSVAVGQTPVTTSLTWAQPAAGTHALYLVASDSVGLSTTTPTIAVNVQAVLPTATATPTASPTVVPPMATPTISPTVVLPTATATPTASPTVVLPTATATPTAGPTVVQPTATATPTASPTVVLPTATATPIASPTVALPTASPTFVVPTPTLTATPTITATATLTTTLGAGN